MGVVVAVLMVLGLLGRQTESSATPSQSSSTLQTLALEEFVPLTREFFPERLSVQWLSDNEYMYTEEDGTILKYNIQNHTTQKIIDEDALNNLTTNKYAVSKFSSDLRYLLLAANKQKVYRYSEVAEYFVYDLEDKSIRNVSQGLLQAAVWGGNQSLAYVQDNNVYYIADVRNPTAIATLTNEGVPGNVYFGVPDWIYEEEIFNAGETLWFSPSGDYLAVAFFNDTLVESTIFPFYGNPLDVTNQYPRLVGFKYPKAGRTNPKAGLRVFKVTDLKSNAWNIPAPVDIVGADNILARVNWASDTNLVVLWTNRRQNIGILINCDLTLDKCVVVKEEVEPDGWINVETPLFNKEGSMMLEIGQAQLGHSRFLHVTRFDFKSVFRENMSPINGTVTDILGWDAERDIVFYVVSPAGTPWQRELWSSTKRGTVTRCITCSKLPSCHNTKGIFSPTAKYAVVSCSRTNYPPKHYIYSAEEDSFRLIKSNDKLTDKLSQYTLPMTLYNKILLDGNIESHVKLTLPPHLDKNRKYPMILRVYAGPTTNKVKDAFEVDYYPIYLSTNRSFIVASIDVRGSGCMGLENMFAVNRALGTVEITDTLAAIKKLTELYPFIDPKRIGVWGWSYGGFVTTMMLVKDTENIIACGAAVAPVTSWLYYDTIYTERYMDTPQNNPSGYEQSDLLLVSEKLRGKKYFLVHGTGDDNVHYQHSLQLAKQLQHADIAFEQMSYTDENHSLLGVSRHFYHALDHFWTSCFKG